jgi:hypothetical protein
MSVLHQKDKGRVKPGLRNLHFFSFRNTRREGAPRSALYLPFRFTRREGAP